MNMYMGTVPLADAGKHTRHPSDITATATRSAWCTSQYHCILWRSRSIVMVPWHHKWIYHNRSMYITRQHKYCVTVKNLAYNPLLTQQCFITMYLKNIHTKQLKLSYVQVSWSRLKILWSNMYLCCVYKYMHIRGWL